MQPEQQWPRTPAKEDHPCFTAEGDQFPFVVECGDAIHLSVAEVRDLFLLERQLFSSSGRSCPP